jgi:hypothetical protein
VAVVSDAYTGVGGRRKCFFFAIFNPLMGRRTSGIFGFKSGMRFEGGKDIRLLLFYVSGFKHAPKFSKGPTQADVIIVQISSRENEPTEIFGENGL